jgi:hypothetical protein
MDMYDLPQVNQLEKIAMSQNRILSIIRELVAEKAKKTTPPTSKIAKPKEEDPGYKITHVNGEPHIMVKTKKGYALQKVDLKGKTKDPYSKYLPPGEDLLKLFNIDIVDK